MDIEADYTGEEDTRILDRNRIKIPNKFIRTYEDRNGSISDDSRIILFGIGSSYTGFPTLTLLDPLSAVNGRTIIENSPPNPMYFGDREFYVEKQGRMALPLYAVNIMGFNKGQEIMFVGVGEVVELWKKSDYLAHRFGLQRKFERAFYPNGEGVEAFLNDIEAEEIIARIVAELAQAA